MWILTFSSTGKTMEVGRLLKNKIKCEVIPVPREISSDCGVVLKVEDKEKAVLLLKEKRIRIDGIYQLN